MATVSTATVKMKDLQSTLQTLTDATATIISIIPIGNGRVVIASKV